MVNMVSVSIPYLVLSTEVSLSGELKRHILTPFGYLAISIGSFHNAHSDQAVIEIRVLGDTESWLLDNSMPKEFRTALEEFISAVARRDLVEFDPKLGMPESGISDYYTATAFRVVFEASEADY